MSKATGVPLAKAAARIAVGQSIAQLRADGLLPASGDTAELPVGAAMSVKEAVMPFGRFHGVDSVLGPECVRPVKSWGSTPTSGPLTPSRSPVPTSGLPMSGRAIITVANRDKRSMIFPVKRLSDLGFEILATQGTADVLRRNGLKATVLRKHADGIGPNGEPTTVGSILAGEVDLVVNTRWGPADARTVTTSARRPWSRGFLASRRSRGWRLRCRDRGAEDRTRGECAFRSTRRTSRPSGQRNDRASRRGDPQRSSRWPLLADVVRGPGIADGFRPGHFVAIAVDDAHILRRAFSIRSASTKAGGALQIIVSPKGPGTKWLVERRPGDLINVIAPLGKPSACPPNRCPAYWWVGAAGGALFELACQLRARGCPVEIIVGAGDAQRLYGVVEARRVSDAVHVTTDDGSAGEHGRSPIRYGGFWPADIRRSMPAVRWECCRPFRRSAPNSGPWRSARSRSPWPAVSACV